MCYCKEPFMPKTDLISFSQHLREIGTDFIPILQIRRLRLEYTKSLGQGHLAQRMQWKFLIMYFQSLEKLHRETILVIIFHVFLRITALLQTPRSDPEGIMTGIVKAWTLDTGSASGMNAAYTLANCSRDQPRREWPGVNARRSGLYQCSP